MSAVDQQLSHNDVKEYYSETLQKSDDLKTSVCTIRGSSAQRAKLSEILKLVHKDVLGKNYGCGLVAPDVLVNQNVLDLGCGSGTDVYVLAKLVGPEGFVVGVDMTEEQLQTARQYVDYHRDVYGYEKANTQFVSGYIEDLKSAGVKDESQDIIVSNCVVNLALQKQSVLDEAFRILKPGGEMYFSDIYCDQPIPEELQKDKVLWGECISGALPWEELHSVAEAAGFCTPILFESSVIKDEKVEKMAPNLKFCSAIYRLFKLDENEGSGCVKVTYKGGIPTQEDSYKFAHNMTFKKGCPLTVPAEVANIMMQSRFSSFFEVGDLQKGTCVTPLKLNPFEPGVSAVSSGGGCCGGGKTC